MKPNPEYIKNLLSAFQKSRDPVTDVSELEEQGFSYRTTEFYFYFHLLLLNDLGFVIREDRKPGIGVKRMPHGELFWSGIPLRLTASGHEFAEAMNNKKAFESIKKSVMSSSLSIMRDVAVSVLKTEIMRHEQDLGH
jgi:hypothetical protein